MCQTWDAPTTWRTLTVAAIFREAAPQLSWSPSYIETGVTPNGFASAALTLNNQGLAPLKAVQLTLLADHSGAPAPDWVYLTSPTQVGDLAIGAAQTASLAISPPDTLSDGEYEFLLRIASANHPTRDVHIYVTVNQSGAGGVIFQVSDMYTGWEDEDGQAAQGVQGAQITLQQEQDFSITVTGSTDAGGSAFFEDLPAGRYKYRITAPNHQSSVGRVWIQPGITAAEAVFLDYDLVSVEWEVTEIALEDRYEVSLNTVYATDVPAAVLIFEPASVSIPAMEPGQSASGELTLTNYGLIRADHIELVAPGEDEFFRFEFLGSLPDSLAPKQSITIPYRITALKSWFQTGATDETGGGCEWYKNCDTVVKWDFLCANGRMTQKELTLCFQSLQCSNDSSDDGSQGAEPPDEDFPGLGSDNGGLDNYQILHFRTRSGGGSGGSSNSDGSGDGTRPANNDPPAKELDIDEMLCYPKGPDSGPFDPQKWYPILRDGDVTVQQKDSQQGWWHSVGCEVNTVNGTFVEQEIDLAVKIPGGMLNIQRTYFKANYGSQQPDAPDDYTWLIGTAGSGQFKMQGYPGDNKLGFTWLGDETRGYLLTQITTVEGTTFSLPPDHFRLRVKYDRDSGEILEEHYEYAGDPVNRTYYEHIEQHGENYIGQGRTLTTTNDGDTWRMEDLSKNWRLYDGDGFLTSSGTANGLLEEMLYDADRKLTGFKDRSGKQVIWVEYNDQEWIAEIRDCEDPADPTARRITYEYVGGRLWKMTDVLGLSVNYQYDEYDRMIAKNDAGAGQQITIGYKDNGWVDYVNDSRGVDREFEYSYDKFYDEWHATIMYSSGQVEEFWYDEDGNTWQMAVDGMVVKIITRSEDGRVETMTGDAGNVQKTYDEWGNLLEVLYANDTTVRYEYDYRFHKISRMIDQRGTEYTYQYDGNGNPEYAVEAKGTSVERVTHYEYYPGGVLQRVTISGGDTEPVSTGYAYDADMRNVVSITDPLERTVELLEHDAAGHALSTRDILGQTWTSEYDARGRQTAQIDPLLRRSSTLYDASNNVKTTTAFGLTTTYGYDDWDRPQSVTDAAGNATLTAYNDRSLPVRVKDCAGHTTAEFVYDATLGLLREAYDSAGNKTAYHYDLNPYTPEHSYAQPVSIEYPTSTTTLTYDIMQRVIEKEHASQDGEIRTTAVTYDAGGNVKTSTDAEGKTTVFEYDALNRLIKHSAPGAGDTEYRYDARDNLVWYKDPNGQADHV